jgi:hypothetical protein
MSPVEVPVGADLAATAAWSQRVRRVGGFIQLAFAARSASAAGPGPPWPVSPW